MNPQILKLNIDKWLKACQYLKSEYENLNVDEQSAIDILCDFWRRDYSTSLVEECESQMQVLKDGHKYHGNNKTIIEKSKELCAVATAMLKDAASFGEFKAEMQKLSRGSSSRSSSSAGRSSSSSSSSSSSRPSAPRPSSSKPSVVIRSVELRATGANNVALGTSSSTVPVGTHYVYPVLKFDALQADTDIWYKIYDGAGVLITGTRRQGFSTVGQFKRGATGGECIGIGSEDGSSYATTGVGRIEFFVNDRLIYTYRFQYVEPPRSNPRPSSSSSSYSRPSSSNSSPFASSSRSYSGGSSSSSYGPSRTTRTSGIKWWAYPLWFFVALAIIWGGFKAYKAFSVEKREVYPITDLCYIGTFDGDYVEFGASIKVEVPEDVNSFYKYKDRLIQREYLLSLDDYNILASAFSDLESDDLSYDKPQLRAKLLDYLKSNDFADGSWRVEFANTVESSYKDLKDNFVFIIRNINTGKRRTIVYYGNGYSDIYDEEAPAKGSIRSLSMYNKKVKVNYTGTGRKTGRSTSTTSTTTTPTTTAAPASAPAAPASSTTSTRPSSSGASSSSARPAQSTQPAQSSTTSADDERAAARRRR